MGARIGVMELLVIVILGFLLLGLTLVLFLRRRRPGTGFPVAPPTVTPPPPEAEEPRRLGH
jgi:LPXTG-motif cell wall-anchored protein